MKGEQQPRVVPLRTILTNFLNHVENLDRCDDDSYEKEFQSLKLFSESIKSLDQFCSSEGERDVNRKKNRYKDILPFDCSRVILSSVASVPGSDYVNANFIKGASGSLAYIASQGPLPNTANDFWRMVIECEVQVIVMACNEEESGKHKCENYWVDREGEEKQHGMAKIRLLKASVVCPDFLVRTMLLSYKKNNIKIERTVCQFHYSAWPDHGVPPLVRPLLDMVRLVRDTQASETLPVLVHCSAGCGRTGTICAIDYVWGLLRAGKLTEDFSLYKLVRDMRKQRIAMVQTKDQYILVHKAVKELFQEQLRMIDAHPYENVDLNGMPIGREEHLYERVIMNNSNDLTVNIPSKRTNFQRVYTPTDETAPPLTLKSDKEVEAINSHKGKVGWSDLDDLRPVDSGLSASSSTTDSTSTLQQESTLIIIGDEPNQSNSSLSSLLHKPRIAKLKALFERSSPLTPKPEAPRTKQQFDILQVTRSHSLGAVRKLAQGDTPVTLYRKLFANNSKTDSKKKEPVPIKRSKSMKVIGEKIANSSNPSSSNPNYAVLNYSAKPDLKRQLQFLIGGDEDEDDGSGRDVVDAPREPIKSILKQPHPEHLTLTRSKSEIMSPLRNNEYVNVTDLNNWQGGASHLRVLPINGQKQQHQVSNEFEALSIEVQRKVNTIVSGLGVRERRSSFRKAIDKESQPKSYEKIWPQKLPLPPGDLNNPQVYGKIQTPTPQRSAKKPVPAARKQLSQQEHLQQLAMAKALSSRPPDPRAVVARLYGPPSSEFTPSDSVYAPINGNDQKEQPMAPPRTKRLGQAAANNTLAQTSGSAHVAKDPIYANAKQLDAWHGAPGVDLDTVAASIGRSPNSTTAQETSADKTASFSKMQNRTPNFRTKLTPTKGEADTSRMHPSPDSRYGGTPSSSTSLSSQNYTPKDPPHQRRQQQYL
ncbi:Hypothetical predicted protein [Cloeon dipterum]|uniref:protein-tyrosine-phosphatase n=1 Tax=Cloeon dipterum TaxID=197152 RepID=A0A8S1CNQ3_9INSE|nr:Hypothetical predicted protein [Cloeon dipterum]